MPKSLAASATFPTIETPRLRLRQHRREDFAAYRTLWADPAITRFIGGGPLSEEEAWYKFLRNAGHWPLLGFGFSILEEKCTATFAGEIGLAYFHRELTPPVENLREAGWILSPAMHGKGYATEAVAAVLAWGDARFSDPRTICLIHPDNAASIRVAQKCDFHEWQRATYRSEPTIIFERTTPR